ncbi:MAG: carboxypeptidase regulatory-like domain-containing protein [Bacteroidota bacterium]
MFSLRHFTTLFFLYLIVWMGSAQSLSAQNGIVSGRLYNALNNEPLAFGSVRLLDSPYGSFTDSTGRFEIKGIKPGLYNFEARYTGFEVEIIYEVQVTNSKPYVLDVAMTEANFSADSVVIVASPFKKIDEAPLSLRTIGTSEIKRNPGGNRDISRVIQSLPGVTSTPGFRNDILIRGGGPNENRYYIDGIETPNINHFATQGASGGPVGLINVDFINEVDFFSGAFPANRGNALSSVFEFRQRPARNDRVGFTATLGSSDLALTMEGPTGENSNFLFSVRRSYLQFLFQAIGLPFLPTYNDYQYKHKFRIGNRHEINIVSLGALDQFALNTAADSTPQQRFILGNLPVQTQWNYTIGASYKYFADNGFLQVVLSRNMINFDQFKFPDNDETQEKIFDYNSQESENKFRIEYTGKKNGFKYNVGANAEYARYFVNTFQRTGFGEIDFETLLRQYKYGVFGSISKKFLKERLILALGLRADGNDFNASMQNLANQLSPRFSASYGITPKLTANFNTGIYYQLPPYTVLGYRDTDSNELLNQDVTYIRNEQVVGGFAYTTEQNSKISIEGFYKYYRDYPFLLTDSISLANLGGDFGAIGNEPVSSTSEGRAYGLEVLIQQRLYKGFYGIVAYTLSWSEFQDNNGVFVPSSWDNRHVVSLTAGKKFGKNWELGVKWRYNSGTPFTPADTLVSGLISVWDLRGREIPDFRRLNSERIAAFSQLDARIDKKWFFKKWSFNLFIDVQNVYNSRIPGPPTLDVVRDEAGNPVPLNIPGQDIPTRYQLNFLENNLGLVQPTLGIVVTY